MISGGKGQYLDTDSLLAQLPVARLEWSTLQLWLNPHFCSLLLESRPTAVPSR